MLGNSLKSVLSLLVVLAFIGSAMVTVSTSIPEDRLEVLVYVSQPGTDTRNDDIERIEGLGDVSIEYDSFVLASLPMSAIRELEASGHTVRIEKDLTMVDLMVMDFDTRDGGPVIEDGLSVSYPDTGTGYFLVQFAGPIKEEWRSDVEMLGGVIHQYVPSNVLIVRMSGYVSEEVAGLDFVRFVDPYHPAYKIQPGLKDWTGVLSVRVVMFEGETEQPVIDAALAMGGAVRLAGGVINRLACIDIPVENIDDIARMEGVMWIERYIDPAWLADPFPTQTAAWVIQTNITGDRKLYDNGINGTGQTIGNADTGIVVSHWAFYDASQSVKYSDPSTQPNDPPNYNHRKVIHYWTFGNAVDGEWGNHGTHSTGVNAGDNIPNGGDGANNGIAFAANISFEDVSQGVNPAYPADLNTLYQLTYNDGARVHSGSMVCPPGGDYSTDSMQLDQFMHNNPDFIGVIANHNYGPGSSTVCDKASAKNSISIGATENAPNQENMVVQGTDYSGRGPTQDGRLKPTITTPTNVLSPGGSSTNDYASFGGTSAATPVAAGGVVLIRDYFDDGFYPSGIRNPSDSINASAALMKAIAINGADEMSGSNAHSHPYDGLPYPTNDQGWGRMNLDNALYFYGDARKLYLDDNATGIATGETSFHLVSVVSSSEPLEITLVWQDYWGTAGAGKKLVNDLDLEIEGPTGTIWKGNVFKTGSVHESDTGGNFDDTNVEENFLLLAPEPGTYIINITGANVPQGPQPFALVATGNFSSKPDVSVKKGDIQFDPVFATEGDEVTVNVTVSALGNGMLPVPVKFFIDGDEVQEWNVAVDLPKNKFSHAWTAVAGFHDFKVVADPADILDEAVESNNMANRTFYVNGYPEAFLNVTPLTIYTKESITANASLSTDDGGLIGFMFDFGDGTTTGWLADPVQVHKYNENGVFNVTLRVRDNLTVASEWTDIIEVTVLNRDPEAWASAVPNAAFTFENITFDASNSFDPDGTITVEWDFGDGSGATDINVKHNYTDDGEYNITLTVTDDDGAEASKMINVTIFNREPAAMMSIDTAEYDEPFGWPTEGTARTVWMFNSTSSDKDGTIDGYVWDFGDGNTSDTASTTHSYGASGEYTIEFYVMDDDGAESLHRWWNVTIINLAPSADFMSNVTDTETLMQVQFTDKSVDIDGDIIETHWKFGDTTESYDEDPVHVYDDNGQYSVVLEIMDNEGLVDMIIKLVNVTNRAPVVIATHNITVMVGETAVFNANESYDLDGFVASYEWYYNATYSKKGPIVEFVFQEAGDFEFTLTIRDDDGDIDVHVFTINVTALPPPPPGGKDDTGLGMGNLIIPLVLLIVMIAVVVGLVAYRMARRPKRPEHIDRVAGVGQTGPPPRQDMDYDQMDDLYTDAGPQEEYQAEGPPGDDAPADYAPIEETSFEDVPPGEPVEGPPEDDIPSVEATQVDKKE